jgi:hypothetical protein
MSNLYKKNKFITNNNYNLNYPKQINISNNVDNESLLLTPIIEDKDKTQLILSDALNPTNYSVNYSNIKKDNYNNFNFYYTNKDQAPGRGFGNLNISNSIRNGDQSRLQTKNYKKQQESTQLFDYQFQYLNKNYQDPNHIVMPIPRGGESTRKQIQLNINKNRIDCHDSNHVEFNYN